MTTASTISLVLESARSHIADVDTRDAIRKVFEEECGAETVKVAEQFFVKLTSRAWPQETLQRVMSGWHDMHQSALFVAGLLVRLLRETTKSAGATQILLATSAAEIAEVIPEDAGVDDTAHDILFQRFARSVTGDDMWRLDRFAVPECREFRQFVRLCRIDSAIPEAMLSIAASENWNSAEYTICSELMKGWCPLEGVTGNELDLEYVHVHAGETELGHFLHAIRAWGLYQGAVGGVLDPDEVACAFRNYLIHLKDAFVGLSGILDSDS